MQNGQTCLAARGRWREILLAVGIEGKILNRKQQPCPMCGGKDRFSFTDRSGDGDYMCRGCGSSKGMKLLMRLKGWDFKTAAQEVDKIIGNLPAATREVWVSRAASKAELNGLWQSGREIAPEDPAGVYLASRGLMAHRALRFVPRVPHFPTKTVHPGLIARFSDATGQPKQIQRLYLTQQGQKAALDPNRMFMPGQLPEGGAIRLGEPAEVMGIAEGIETALAASTRFGMVVWAATAANMMEKWEPPSEAKRIIVFGDNDKSHVGQIAAHTLAHRLDRDKIEVEVRIPETAGTDWADQ